MERVDDLRWRKESFSGNSGASCVEVGQALRSVLVRDTKDDAGTVLRFSPGAWRRFVDRVRHRQLIRPGPG